MDVHKRDGHGSDKVATIYGAPEACGVAANRILDIIRKEERDDELPLKLLAHNALIGRLIGRDGRNLKQIQVFNKTQWSIILNRIERELFLTFLPNSIFYDSYSVKNSSLEDFPPHYVLTEDYETNNNYYYATDFFR